MITDRYGSSLSGDFWWGSAGDWGNGPSRPLILVHGGPGFTSYYLEPLLALAERIPLIFWDQAGCGRSKKRGGRKDFSVEGFVDELEALRISAGIEQMHLLGHSFGGVIIGEYALRYPQRVLSANFVSASLDIPQWRADAARLRTQLPLMIRMILTEGDRTGNFSSPQYLAALAEYTDRFIYRFNEKPACVRHAELESDAVTYRTVWGPNELVVSGTAKDYSLLPRLSQLHIPTAFMCGRFDEATPEAHALFASHVEGSRLVIFEDSAHHPHINETTLFISEVLGLIEANRV